MKLVVVLTNKEEFLQISSAELNPVLNGWSCKMSYHTLYENGATEVGPFLTDEGAQKVLDFYVNAGFRASLVEVAT